MEKHGIVKEKNKHNYAFVVGAERAGTTWCWNMLLKNPQILLCNPKEPDYYSVNYDKERSWYARFFTKKNNAFVTVDVSPSYLCSEQSAHRIKQDCPDANIVIILRNPFDRAVSNAMFRSAGFQKNKDSIIQLISNTPLFIEHSLYFDHVSRFKSTFGDKSVHVFWYEDLKKDPELFFKNLQGVLGVRPIAFKKNFKARVNASKTSFFMGKKSFELTRQLYRFLKNTPIVSYILERIEKKTKLKYWFLQFFRSKKSVRAFRFLELFSDADKQCIENDLQKMRRLYPTQVGRWFSG